MDRIGPYVIERRIGTGGMGTVYLASHEETGQRAAVKVLPASLAREEGFLARFEREIASLRQLDNPNVVKVFDSGAVSDGSSDSQAYYYAMEYVEGETLLMKLRRERRLPWPTVIDYGSQICTALKAAHDAGIVHRDLKPSNLLVSNDGVVKLADFGVAQVFASSRLTKTGGIVGTAEFMSPEQAQGQRATKKSDLYSLGAVMYTMLAGKPPYSGLTMLDVLHKHRFGQFDRPRHYAPDCPSWLEEIVTQLLEKDPDKRPADAYVTGKRLREVLKKVELSQSEPLPASLAAPLPILGPPTGQEILSAEDGGLGSESYFDADAPTRTAPGITSRDTPAGPRGPGEATIMHALMREEIARQQERHPIQEFFENTWVLVGLLGLLLLGGWFWYQSLPTPEWHWAEAERLIAAEEYSTARLEHLRPLLSEDGEWPAKAEARIAEVERLEGRNGPKVARRSSRPDPAAPVPIATTADTEADVLLRRAETYRDLGDTPAALRTVEAFLAVASGREEYAVQVARANRLLGSLNGTSNGTQRTTFIRSSLDRAAKLREEGKPDAAQEIYRGLLTLYGDDPAVTELLAPARQAVDGPSQ